MYNKQLRDKFSRLSAFHRRPADHAEPHQLLTIRNFSLSIELTLPVYQTLYNVDILPPQRRPCLRPLFLFSRVFNKKVKLCGPRSILTESHQSPQSLSNAPYFFNLIRFNFCCDSQLLTYNPLSLSLSRRLAYHALSCLLDHFSHAHEEIRHAHAYRAT